MPIEFQLEPALGDIATPEQGGKQPFERQVTADDLTAAFAGLLLRGSFSRNDARVLGYVSAACGPLVLQSKSRTYYPNSARIENLDSLAAAVRLCGDAQVSIRCRVSVDGYTQDSYVTGARIGTFEGEDMILACPSGDHRDGNSPLFSELVRQFRESCQRAEELVSGFNSREESDSITAVIRQSTGTVLTASENFIALAGGRPETVIDQPFEPLQTRLMADHPRLKVRLDQIGQGILPLVRIHILNAEAEQPPSVEASLPELVRSIRNRVGSLAGMARHIEGMISQAPGDLPHELMRLLVEQAGELDHHLLHLEHAAGERCQPACVLDPAPIVRQTVTELLRRHDHLHVRLGMTDGHKIVAPPHLFGELIESIIEAHAGADGNGATTVISLDSNPSAQTASMLFTTTRSGSHNHGGFQPDWQQQAIWLAHRIGWTVRFTMYPTSGTLESRLTHATQGM